jgi:hypothetical protein
MRGRNRKRGILPARIIGERQLEKDDFSAKLAPEKAGAARGRILWVPQTAALEIELRA